LRSTITYDLNLFIANNLNLFIAIKCKGFLG